MEKQTLKLWFVGKLLIVDGVELGWMPEGVFYTEREASDAAKEEEFIALFEVGKMLPENAVDAEKLYFPRHEKWEDSTLYKIQTGKLSKDDV